MSESFEGMTVSYVRSDGGWWTRVTRPGQPLVTWWQAGSRRPRRVEIQLGVQQADEREQRQAHLDEKGDLGWGGDDA